MSTRLPGPGFHCRSDSPTAVRPWVDHWGEHLLVDVKRQVSKSCGDLIFSSHTIFTILGLMTYIEFGAYRLVKAVAVALSVINSFLIVASRKHYSVDVVVAWYAVPLVYHAIANRWNIERESSQERYAIFSNPNFSNPKWDDERDNAFITS